MSIKPQSLQFNKVNFHNLEQEKNMLKVTMEYISTENLKLKQQVEDMRITVRHNKEQLDEYVTKITNKDKIFEKMNSQIEQLTSRLKILESKNKQQNKKLQSDQLDLKFPISFPSLLMNNNLVTTNATTIQTNKEDNGHSNNNNNNKGLHNSKNNEDKAKEFFLKQAEILEDITIIKDDVQFLLENKTKTKMKEHLDNSIHSNRSFNSNISHSNRFTNNGLNDSVSLNSSIVSNLSTNTIKKKLNLKDKFNLDTKFSQFLLGINSKKSIVLMIDNKGSIWELIKRKDLTINNLKSHPEFIKSLIQNDMDTNTGHSTNNIIDSRDYDNRSLKQSEFDLSKSDFNLSKIIKESDLVG